MQIYDAWKKQTTITFIFKLSIYILNSVILKYYLFIFE